MFRNRYAYEKDYSTNTLWVDDSNKDVICLMLKVINGRCTTNTMSYEDVVSACDEIEHNFKNVVSKKALNGVEFRIEMGTRKYPNEYRLNHQVMGTGCVVEYRRGRWHVLYCYRSEICSSSYKPFSIKKSTALFDQSVMRYALRKAYRGWMQ